MNLALGRALCPVCLKEYIVFVTGIHDEVIASKDCQCTLTHEQFVDIIAIAIPDWFKRTQEGLMAMGNRTVKTDRGTVTSFYKKDDIAKRERFARAYGAESNHRWKRLVEGEWVE